MADSSATTFILLFRFFFFVQLSVMNISSDRGASRRQFNLVRRLGSFRPMTRQNTKDCFKSNLV
jgi:hypothetical protein